MDLDEISRYIHSDIKIADYKNGWFGKFERCATGEDIFSWAIQYYDP
jgi:hypothetical protein